MYFGTGDTSPVTSYEIDLQPQVDVLRKPIC